MNQESLTPEEEARLGENLAGPGGRVMIHIPGRFLWVEASPEDVPEWMRWWDKK